VKTYKLWVEIEEYDTSTGEYRSLTEEGSTSPVPIAQFTDLESAVRFAESLAIDAAVGVPAAPYGN
jgi:hypothetical protein